MEMLKKTLLLSSVDLKFSGKDGRTFSGYASTFNNIDSYGDTIMPGAYKDVVKAGSKAVKMFFNHQSWEFPVGKWLSMKEDDIGLLVEGELTKGNSLADNLYASMKHGTVDGLSIGYRLNSNDFIESEDGSQRTINRITELVEVSPVIFPADDDARVDLASVKSSLEGLKSLKDLESFLRDEGRFSKAVCKTFVSRAKSIIQRDAGEEEELNIIKSLGSILQNRSDLMGKLQIH